MKYLIYDYESIAPSQSFEQYSSPNLRVINAAPAIAKCNGCFRCWLRNPGECFFADSMQHIGSLLLSSDEIIIVCKSLYGGFSVNIKKIIDRVIPGVLPFFEKTNNELHHCKRYDVTPSIKVIFYNANDMTSPEQEQAKNMIAAVALNFHARDYNIVFSTDLDKDLQEVLS